MWVHLVDGSCPFASSVCFAYASAATHFVCSHALLLRSKGCLHDSEPYTIRRWLVRQYFVEIRKPVLLFHSHPSSYRLQMSVCVDSVCLPTRKDVVSCTASFGVSTLPRVRTTWPWYSRDWLSFGLVTRWETNNTDQFFTSVKGHKGKISPRKFINVRNQR